MGKPSKNNIENRGVAEEKLCSICGKKIKPLKVIIKGKSKIIKCICEIGEVQ